MTPSCRHPLILCLAFNLAGHAAEPARTLAVLGAAPTPAFTQAITSAGWTMVHAAKPPLPTADVVVVQTRCDQEAIATALIPVLDHGGAVILAVAEAGVIHERLEARLPVNGWSFAKPNLLRGAAGLVPAKDGILSSVREPLTVAQRFDLHLPGAPIENGMMRYQWERHAKDPLVSDWVAACTTAADGHLPALVTARSGPGRCAVFAASLWDAQLAASPGYAAFCTALLAWAAERGTPADGTADDLTLEIFPHQPDGLRLLVRNGTRTPARTVVSWKTCSWGREHLAARSQAMHVPALGSVVVTLDDATPADALPWRRVDAALLTPDRSRIVVRHQVCVTKERLVSAVIEEDVPARGDAPADATIPRTEDSWCDGRLAKRHVLHAGIAPTVTVLVRNGRMNLAPIATVSDLGMKDNPTTGGLNDLSWSVANVRKDGIWQGGWTGAPAAEQRLALSWPMPVTVVGQRLHGYGSFRRWERANPGRFTVSATTTAGERDLLRVDAATFTARRGIIHTYHDDALPAPALVHALRLHITGLDPKAATEPFHRKPGNCSLQEWEVFGWPDLSPPPRCVDDLVVTATRLLDGTSRELLRTRIALDAGAEQARPVTVPADAAFGPVRLTVRFGGAIATHDWLFLPEGGTHLITKESLADLEQGLLCSPGWVQTLGFGLGMRSQTQGWGGDDDKIWALVNGQMETDSRVRDASNRLFTTCTRFSHYTNPWRETPGGWYGWDLAIAAIRDRAVREKKTRVHVVGSDRWNGIPIGHTWGWGEFVRFDQHLRATGGTGLQGRSRGAIAQEIQERYGDRWQRWQMAEYTRRIEATRERFAAAGLAFSFETHGSFPLCGGELGGILARTHRSVGTDLFWELRNQDLYWSLGTRFGLVAANPSLQSGAYGQWGWVNDACNQWWYANNGGVDPARRQWYAAYTMGRITLDGSFAPYHVTGFSYQGDHGTRMHPDDMEACVATGQLLSRVRPEAAAGCVLAVSWALHERRMGSELGPQGFGLHAGKGREQIDTLFAHAFDRLAKHGLPVGLVAAAESLPGWEGSQPLVLVDGFAWDAVQLAQVERLNRAGAPVLIIGDDAEAQGDAAATLCGVRRGAAGWEPADATTRRLPLADHAIWFLSQRSGRAPVGWCPLPARQLTAAAAQALAQGFLAAIGDPLRLDAGIACTPMISRDRLWLPLCDQGDRPRTVAVSVVPRWFLPRLAGAVQAIDVERGERLEVRQDAASDRLAFSIAMPGTGARMVLIDRMAGEKTP